MAEAFVHSALLECRGECVINDPARKSFEIYDFSSKFAALFLASGLITGWEGEEFRGKAFYRPIDKNSCA